MHRSFFEYPITRAYPFRWFTPVALFGVLISLIVFSIVNVASTGHTLINQYTSDPNITSSQSWFQNWPSLGGGRVSATCQAAVAPVSSIFLTNNSALSYEVTAVTRYNANGGKQSLPALIYNNNPLESCDMLSITILLNSAIGSRSAAQVAWAPWEAVLEGRLACNVANADGIAPTTLNMTAYYNLVPSSVSIYTGSFTFTGRNESTQASLWWGESLLAGYWYALTRRLDIDNHYYYINQNKSGVTSGFIYFTPSNVTDIRNQSYYNLLHRWIKLTDYNGDTSIYGQDNDTAATLIAGHKIPKVWTEADMLAKAFYSTVMTDLGQAHARSNILTDPALLTYFTSNLSTIESTGNRRWGPMNVQYNASNSTTGPLGVKPAVLTMEYLCQVPVLKDTGSLLVSLIVADLVFVQALWYMFRQGIAVALKRNQPDMNFCEACAQRSGVLDNDLVPLQPVKNSTGYEGLRDVSYSGTSPLPTPPSKYRINFRDDGWQRLDSGA